MTLGNTGYYEVQSDLLVSKSLVFRKHQHHTRAHHGQLKREGEFYTQEDAAKHANSHPVLSTIFKELETSQPQQIHVSSKCYCDKIVIGVIIHLY